MMQLSNADTGSANAATALTSKLSTAITVVSEATGKESALTKRLESLYARLEKSHLQVAILGQFKRGKSTFVNALLGVPILPTGVVPLTALPTFISWNERPIVRVSFLDAKPVETFESTDIPAIEEYLSRFVTEERNPKNALAVQRVDLLYPAPFLHDGTVFIDTPGIGSTLMHNTEAAVRVIPECDASLFIVSADPPITQAELDYLRSLRDKVGRIFFIVNKVDYLSAPERRKAIEFLRSVLAIESLFDLDNEIFAVSARSGLAAKQANDPAALEQSGIGAVEARLKQFATLERAETLRAAITQKLVEVLALAESEALLRIETIQIPLDVLERKAAEFTKSLSAIEAKRTVIADMLSGEKRRLIEDLETQIGDLREKVGSEMTQKIEEASRSEGDWKAQVMAALATNLENKFLSAQEQFVLNFSRRAGNIVADYQQQIEALVSEVRRTAADLFSVPFASQQSADSFQLDQEPYWVTEHVQTGLLPDLSPFIDRLLSNTLRTRRQRLRIIDQAKELIIRNAENLRWAILRGLDETFRAVALSFDEMLRDVMLTTKDVVDETIARRSRGSFESGPVLQSLKRYQDELAEVRASLVSAR